MSSILSELEIFGQPEFEESIIKEERHTYRPTVASYNYSDEIEIIINQHDMPMALYDAEFHIEMSFLPEEGSTKCQLTKNFATFLFESISYELNGIEVERIRDPGLISTLKTYLCFNEMELKGMYTAGWIDEDVNSPRSIAVALPLKYLFSIFMDYNKVMIGKHRFRLVRARNDNNCYVSSDDKKATLQINSIELKVSHIHVHDAIKLNLLQKIEKDLPIVVPFRKWEIYELPALRNSSKDIWPIRTNLSLERPRWVIVAFQKNRKNNPKQDINLFDHNNLRNLKLYLNSEFYPYEAMQINFNENKYIESYVNYCQFKSKFFGTKDVATPLLKYSEFAEKALFVIDCSKQNESLKSTTVDVRLEIESHQNFATYTSAICLIIYDSMFEYYPLSSQVRTY